MKIRSSNTNNKNNENVSYLNSVEDGWLENVHPSVDFVRDEFLGLFNEAFNFAIGGLVNDDTVLRGFVNFCDHNCTLKLNEAQNITKNISLLCVGMLEHTVELDTLPLCRGSYGTGPFS